MSRVCKCVVAIALSLAMALPGAAGAEGGMAYGDRGESVRAMQNRLTELGFFAGDVDGIYGDETQTAVKNFQTANGLANTGTADEITIARMRSEEAVAKDAYLEALVAQARQKESQMVAQPGDEGEAVLQVQNRLVELGYASGEASGRFGNATAESVSAFQAANGLPVTGAVNVATYDALFAESAIAYRAASTAASADTSLYLAKGDEGHNVEILQGYLREYGYYALEEDGVFDDGVEAAVLQFQRQNALEETGRVDATMRDMLSSGDVAYESAYAAQLHRSGALWRFWRGGSPLADAAQGAWLSIRQRGWGIWHEHANCGFPVSKGARAGSDGRGGCVYARLHERRRRDSLFAGALRGRFGCAHSIWRFGRRDRAIAARTGGTGLLCRCDRRHFRRQHVGGGESVSALQWPGHDGNRG